MMNLKNAREGWRTAAVLAAAAAASLAAPLAGAQEDELQSPAGWQTRTDRGGDGAGSLKFWEMPPGWHVTTGPAAIFFNPETLGSGDYRVESEVFLFDPEQRNEGFGIFVGGTGLEGEEQAYTYLLLRQDGSVLVKRRDGPETSVLYGWTKNDAVVSWEGRAAGAATAGNVLYVEVAGDEVAFGVNGSEVFRTARDGLQVDGIVGLRVNHGLDVHYSSLEVASG